MVNSTPALVHSGREVIYNLFYRTFIDSPADDLYTMLEDLFPILVELGDDCLVDSVNNLQIFMRERALAGENLKEFDLDTLRNYTRILCLTDSVPTAESYYVSIEKLVMQEARDKVLRYFSDFEMKKSNVYNEFEDFVANEMHFMSYMAQLTAKAIQTEDSARMEELILAQYNFLKEHPLCWIPEFTTKINTFKESERIYGPMAIIMNEFLKRDASFLEELLPEHVK